jgi:hypothetical protein
MRIPRWLLASMMIGGILGVPAYLWLDLLIDPFSAWFMVESEMIWAAVGLVVCFGLVWLLCRLIKKAQAGRGYGNNYDYPIYPPPHD